MAGEAADDLEAGTGGDGGAEGVAQRVRGAPVGRDAGGGEIADRDVDDAVTDDYADVYDAVASDDDSDPAATAHNSDQRRNTSSEQSTCPRAVTAG